MTIKTIQEESDIMFFSTFSCFKWISLFEIANFYDNIYKWFSILNKKNCKITAYVIMPNHLHLLIYIPPKSSIQELFANGKRFMAYKIVEILKREGKNRLLKVLAEGVPEYEKKKGKKHQVFNSSFDAKPIYSEKFLLQKLDYIHHNPVIGKWNLVGEFTDYIHSSARYYELGEHATYKITDFREIF